MIICMSSRKSLSRYLCLIDKMGYVGRSMVEKIFSKCGMRCDLCLIYRPNVQENDRREEICKVFSKIYPDFEADPKTIICDGCSCGKENPVLLDPECRTRKCVIGKGLEHCGHCDAYPCEIFPAEPTKEELIQKIEVEKQWTWEEEKLMEAYTCRKNMDRFLQKKRELKELGAWEQLLKRIVFQTFEDVQGKRILDFGSGEGITANFFAAKNEVVAVEPWEEMLQNRWCDNGYEQIQGGIEEVSKFPSESFDMIICHNVLEYIDEKERVLKELVRVLRPEGTISLIKHNRCGRVMQMAVLLDDLEKANDLLDGKDSAASKFGAIRYYEDDDVTRWAPELELKKCLGIRTFWDLQQNQGKHGDEDWQKEMMELELRVSEMDEFRKVAFFHHLILEKKEDIFHRDENGNPKWKDTYIYGKGNEKDSYKDMPGLTRDFPCWMPRKRISGSCILL